MSSSPQPIYHFDLSVSYGRVVAFVNDFPVAELHTMPRRELSLPINPYLVGADNELRVVAHPNHVEQAPEIHASVRRFVKGSIAGPGMGDEVVRVGATPAELLGPLPWTLRTRFSTLDTASFSDELRVAKPYDDRAALIDYALHLRKLVELRQRDALVDELRPKIEAYARAYAEPVQRFVDGLAEVIDTELLTGHCDLDFNAQSVELVPCCGGRIWSVQRSEGRALLRTTPDSSGSSYQLPVFVGERGGRLRVVR